MSLATSFPVKFIMTSLVPKRLVCTRRTNQLIHGKSCHLPVYPSFSPGRNLSQNPFPFFQLEVYYSFWGEGEDSSWSNLEASWKRVKLLMDKIRLFWQLFQYPNHNVGNYRSWRRMFAPSPKEKIPSRPILRHSSTILCHSIPMRWPWAVLCLSALRPERGATCQGSYD